MINTIWRMSARLVRRQANAFGFPASVQVASGSLEDMILLAADLPSYEADTIAIECDGLDHPLGPEEIEELRREPTFPIEI